VGYLGWAPTAFGASSAAALLPERVAKLTTRMVAKHFENADGLEPRPAYLRRSRSLGVGLVAAGVAGLVLEAYGDDDAGEPASE
jgi:hypothetical protein